MLLGAHSVGVLDRAAEVEHGKHGDDHHHTLEQQGELKLLPYPVRVQTKHWSHSRVQIQSLYRREQNQKNTIYTTNSYGSTVNTQDYSIQFYGVSFPQDMSYRL